MSTHKYPMETYHGIVRTPADAIKLFEACRLGLLPRVQRRLSEKERQAIRSGSVFVWDEREAGMRRWTDGKSWSASRVSGSFLTYREMEGKRGGGFNTMRRVSGKTPDSSGRGSDEDQDEGEPDGYRYKADGLMKQSFSITTSSGQHLHLISYFARPTPGESDLPQPSTDPSLRGVIPIKGMYPESSISDNTPIAYITRLPMSQHHQPPHYVHQTQPPPPHTGIGGAPYHQSYPPPTYGQQGYSWPPSPVATPPYSHHYTTSSTGSYPPQQQHLQQPPPHTLRSRTPPHPTHSSYYPNQAPYGHPPPSSHPPSYGSALPPPPSSQHERMPLPPPKPTGPSHYLSTSPRSIHRQTNPPPQASSAQLSPGSRSRLPALPQGPLPALPATTAPATATAHSAHSSTSSALTPPYQQQQKPYPSDAYANGGSPSAGNGGGNSKASLSALLLHPTPSGSEPGSAHAGDASGLGSSPSHPSVLPGPPTSGQASGGGPPSLVHQQYLQLAPSGEDSRALSRLDRKFCI